jgi:signal peptidase I
MRGYLRETFITILIAVVVFLALQTTVQSFIVFGPSMEDSFHDQERLLVLKSRVAYAFHEPERGDVTVFEPPGNRRGDYIKRIIGVPGDVVEVRDETVYVNGKELEESYIKDAPRYTLSPTEVPEDNFFVLGDNRNNSNDSHSGWTVPRENIIGKVWLTIWPPGEWGLAPDYSLDEQLAGF